jgi:hypothetical protein
VSVLGRLLGRVALPAGAATAAIPLIAARRIDEPQRLADSAPGAGLDDLRTARWQDLPVELDRELFSSVSDERAILESRPYYRLLGQAIADTARALGEPPSGNGAGARIHRDPAAFRGQRFTASAWVHQVQRDELVALDRPYGITTAWRVLGWSRDLDPVEVVVDGVPTIKSAPLRLYEFCIVADAPPAPRTRIAITGRFFKFRAIPVTPDLERDRALGLERQSNRVYPFVYAAAGWTGVPPVQRGPWTWIDAAMLLGAIALVAVLILVVRRDQRRESAIPGIVARLRAGRARLRAARKPDPPPSG